tara:strand:- start:272 stop:973 length:702 start_codon:yes stop_codon:yes gene_type:complete
MKITFGIATYNNINNLIFTLNSIQIAMKSFRKFKYEIIIIDDNSVDKTEVKIKRIKKNKKFIKYFKNNSNLGFRYSIFRAAKKGKGSYFKIIHSSNIENIKDLKIYLSKVNYYELIMPYIIDRRNFFRKFLSRFCTAILNFFSGKNIKYYQSPIMCKRNKFIHFFPKLNKGSFFLATTIFRLTNFYSQKQIYEFGIEPKFKSEGSTAVSFNNLLSFIYTIIDILYFRLKKLLH